MFKDLINKLKVIFVCILFATITSGCLRVEENISIDKMGSYEHSFSVLMDSQAAEMVNQMNGDNTTLKNKLHSVLQGLGFANVSDIEGGKEVGSVGVIKGSLNELNFADFNTDMLSITDNSKDKFVYKSYDIKATFKPYMLEDFKADNGQSLLTDYMLTVNLPVKATSNATTVSADELTHSWKIKPNSSNTIEIKFDLLNITNIIICCVVVLLAVLLLVFLLLKGNKKQNKNEDLKTCIVCGKQIKKAAKKCKYCKSWQESESESVENNEDSETTEKTEE